VEEEGAAAASAAALANPWRASMGAFKVARGRVSSDSSSEDGAVLGTMPYVAYLCGYKYRLNKRNVIRTTSTDRWRKSRQRGERLLAIARLTLIDVEGGIHIRHRQITYLQILTHHDGNSTQYCVNKTAETRYLAVTAVELQPGCDQGMTACQSFGFA
jgi:hypothetical protein